MSQKFFEKIYYGITMKSDFLYICYYHVQAFFMNKMIHKWRFTPLFFNLPLPLLLNLQCAGPSVNPISIKSFINYIWMSYICW